MTTLPNCKGSYTKRSDCSKYLIKFPLGWNQTKGNYDYYHESVDSEPEAILVLKSINEFIYFGGAKTKKSILAMRKKKQIEELETKEEALITLDEFALDYAQMRHEQEQISNRTYDSYLQILHRVKPYIGDLPLCAITTKDIDNMWRTMKSPRNKNLSGNPYTGATLNKTYTILNTIFNHAIDYELITKNPMTKAQKPKSDTKEKETLTENEARTLFASLTTKPLNPFTVGILIGLLTGVRISEMLALTWEDYSKGTLRINKSLERDSQVSKCTKNGEDRYITCPPSLIQILKSWKPIQQTYFKDKLYIDWSRTSPIVNAKWGNHQTQSNFRRWVRFHSEEYNIPDNFYFHKLRHTYVTFLYRNCGVDEETTRKLSGHKSPQAFKGYTHTNDEYKRKATDKLDSIFTSSACNEQCCKSCSLWSPSPNKDKGTCWRTNTPQITDNNHTCDNFSAI